MSQAFVPTHTAPPTPGDMLLEELIKPLGLSLTAFADKIGIPRVAVSEIVHGHRGISPLMALRLVHALNTTEQFWINLQMSTDLFAARQSDEAKKIKKLPVLCKTKAS
jgi:antitoxin HigA-1